jgi:hypothetical protein
MVSLSLTVFLVIIVNVCMSAPPVMKRFPILPIAAVNDNGTRVSLPSPL